MSDQLLRNFEFSANRENTDVSLDDNQIETFFWAVVRDNPENFSPALQILEMHRNDVVKKIAKSFLNAMSGDKILDIFIDKVTKKEVTDDRIETLFWFVVDKTPEKFCELISMLNKHRNELAQKIAQDTLDILTPES